MQRKNIRSQIYEKVDADLDKLSIRGEIPLCGEVEVSGAKNAVVAILPAVLLAEGPCRIENIPDISDVEIVLKMLYQMGANIRMINRNTVTIDCSRLNSTEVSYELARKMRASYYFAGALLGRYGQAEVPMPGGCNLGVRPIDQHVKAFEALGASVTLERGVIDVKANEEGLIGGHIYFDTVTVGGTINLMLAAVKAKGQTVIENAAKEPHVVDVANFLNSIGADIKGAGTDTIKIKGVETLTGGTYSIIPDQIEAGTYMVAAAATGGRVLIKNVIPKHLEAITAKLIEMNVQIVEYDDAVLVSRNEPLQKANIKTQVYPGIPTDMQPQFTVLLSQAEGTSIITEGVSDSRYRYVDELNRMGSNIKVDGKVAVVSGASRLTGAPVKACDLRAGACLIIAGLIANGSTLIEEISHIERGYDNIVEKLSGLGADIKRVTVQDAIPAMEIG